MGPHGVAMGTHCNYCKSKLTTAINFSVTFQAFRGVSIWYSKDKLSVAHSFKALHSNIYIPLKSKFPISPKNAILQASHMLFISPWVHELWGNALLFCEFYLENFCSGLINIQRHQESGNAASLCQPDQILSQNNQCSEDNLVFKKCVHETNFLNTKSWFWILGQILPTTSTLIRYCQITTHLSFLFILSKEICKKYDIVAFIKQYSVFLASNYFFFFFSFGGEIW